MTHDPRARWDELDQQVGLFAALRAALDAPRAALWAAYAAARAHEQGSFVGARAYARPDEAPHLRDLLHVAHVYGRCLGTEDAPEALAASTLEHLREAFCAGDTAGAATQESEPASAALRAAVLHGFVSVQRERAVQDALAPYAAALVALPAEAPGPGAFSVFLGPESVEPERVEGLMRLLRRRGARHVFVAGDPAACDAVAEACDLVGIRHGRVAAHPRV